MTGTKVRGYAAKQQGQPLELFEYDPPRLGEHEVRVSITHCGVCHTDLHAIDNYYGIVTFPLVPGHEIVGHVCELGRSVSGLKEGDRVGLGWEGRSCGKCEWCLKGEEQLCMDIVPSGTWVPYGGFATSVVADHRFVYPLPPEMRPEVAAVLMCAGVTVYSPLRAHAAGPETKVGVVGVGGLGHLMIQFARAVGCEVTALSSSPGKREEALAFGADRFVDLNDPAGLRQLDYAFDLLMCTSSGGVPWEGLLMTMKKRGRLVLLGFPDISLNSTDLVAHELSITGSFLGSRAIMQEMLAFAQEHALTPKIELMPMARVNEALQRVRDNRARYRIVLANEQAPAGGRG